MAARNLEGPEIFLSALACCDSNFFKFGCFCNKDIALCNRFNLSSITLAVLKGIDLEEATLAFDVTSTAVVDSFANDSIGVVSASAHCA